MATIPPELITKVAGYIVADTRDAAAHEAVAPWGWTKLTLICKSWRTAVMNRASLWKNVVITSRRALEAVFARTRNIPVNVSGTLDAEARGVVFKKELRELSEELSALEENIAMSRKYGGWLFEQITIREVKTMINPRGSSTPLPQIKCELRELNERLDSVNEELHLLETHKTWNTKRMADIERDFDMERELHIQKLAPLRRKYLHLRSLHLKASSSVLAKLSSPIRSLTPILEDLYLCRTDKREPADLSRFASPVLRRLKLLDFDFDDFRMLVGSGLTHLELVGMGVMTTTGDVVQMLSCAPNLEELRLHVQLQSSPDQIALVRSVELTKLRRWYLGVLGVGDAELLSFVRTPSLERAKIHITCTSELDQIAMLIGRRIDGLRTTELGGCMIWMPNEQSIHFTLTPEEGGEPTGKGICVEFDEFDRFREDLVLDLIAKHFPPVFRSIGYLSVHGARAFGEAGNLAWRELFLLMPDVTYFHLAGRHTSILPTGLAYRNPSDQLCPWPPLFPALEFLKLDSVWFRNASGPAEQEMGDFVDRLIRSCQRQSENALKGLTLKSVTINTANPVNAIEEDLAQLESIFGDWDWGGNDSKDRVESVLEEGEGELDIDEEWKNGWQERYLHPQ